MNQNARFPEMQAVLGDAHRLAEVGFVPLALCAPTDPDPTAKGSAAPCSIAWHGAPCDRAGKRPIARYRHLVEGADASRALLRAFKTAGTLVNIAIVTGAEGLLVVEADSPEADAELQAIGGEALKSTVIRGARPGRGPGYLFIGPDRSAPANGSHRGESGAIDVKGRNGIFVVPPSRHLTGHVYSWVAGHAPWELDVAPLPDGLRGIVYPEPRPGVPRARSGTPTSPRLEVRPGLTPRVEFLLRARRKLAMLWRGEGKTHGDCSRSGYDHALAVELLEAGVSPDDVMSALAARPDAHRRDVAYLAATVDHAGQATRRSQ